MKVRYDVRSDTVGLYDGAQLVSKLPFVNHLRHCPATYLEASVQVKTLAPDKVLEDIWCTAAYAIRVGVKCRVRNSKGV